MKKKRKRRYLLRGKLYTWRRARNKSARRKNYLFRNYTRARMYMYICVNSLGDILSLLDLFSGLFQHYRIIASVLILEYYLEGKDPLKFLHHRYTVIAILMIYWCLEMETQARNLLLIFIYNIYHSFSNHDLTLNPRDLREVITSILPINNGNNLHTRRYDADANILTFFFYSRNLQDFYLILLRLDSLLLYNPRK